MSFTVVIPARYGSERLPGKVLCDIAGQPLIRYVHQCAVASGAARVIIATDERRVEDAALAFGAEVVMTDPGHRSGTDRIAEALAIVELSDDTIVVNLQGDEPQMPPGLVSQVASLLVDTPGADIATLVEPIDDRARIFDPNLVKVVAGVDGRAMYFSRAPIPWERGTFERAGPSASASRQPAGDAYLGHIGIYAYRAGFVQTFTQLPKCEAEGLEALEQLRALYHGYSVQVALAEQPAGRGVDTPEDLQRVRESLA